MRSMTWPPRSSRPGGVHDPDPVVPGVGVDEKVMNRAGPGRRRRFVTVLVDLATGRPLDIVEGRSKRVLKACLVSRCRYSGGTSTPREMVPDGLP